MARRDPRWLRQQYLPPAEGMALESAVMTTYRVNWAFVEEDLLAPALGVRSPVSRVAAFRSEIERRLRQCEVSILHDLRAAERSRLSPQIDPIPIAPRKLHAKVSLLMWSAPDRGGAVRRHVRVLIGSANLTRQGFRDNYEVVAALDYGERQSGRREILYDAVRFLREMTADGRPHRLEDQLASFEAFARDLPAGPPSEDQPWKFVAAADVAPALVEAWREAGGGSPDTLVIASPFWPDGEDPAEPVLDLVRRLGRPGRIELVCQAAGLVDGRPVPVIPGALPVGLKRALSCTVVVRPVRDGVGVVTAEDDEVGEATEDDTVATPPSSAAAVRRELHAKVIAVRGRRGSVLYVGSSNCTRRGLGLRGGADGRHTNWEAGLVYRLSPRRAGVIDSILECAGAPIEVRADRPLKTQEPPREGDAPAPVFLKEILGTPRELTIHFRPDEPVPSDVVVLMPDERDPERFWLLWRRAPGEAAGHPLCVALDTCPLVDPTLKPTTGLAFDPRALSTWVEVRWENARATFPVRYDDKDDLPPAPGARRYTESELIDYYAHGREPGDGDAGPGSPPAEDDTGAAPTEVDTRRILSYFIRRFVEAIPGIEADLERAWHSRPALAATLTGPTGVVTLAEAAVKGLVEGARPGEPAKTPVAAGFQLVEIIAVLRRTRGRAPTDDARALLDRAASRCQDFLEDLATQHPQLKLAGFAHYRRLFAEKSS